MRGVLIIAGLFCLIAALLLGGTAPFGRLALSWGMPGLASVFFDEPDWRGVAQYRSGQAKQAAAEFRQSGATFNQGNALVAAGEFAAALEAYDIALLKNSQDVQARANFDLLAAFYAGTRIDPEAAIKWSGDRGPGDTVEADVAKGNARASGAGDDVTNTGALVGLPQLLLHGERRVRKVFDDKFMVANDRWLATLSDVPGSFLAERIKHEYKRRVKAGEAPPPGDPEW